MPREEQRQNKASKKQTNKKGRRKKKKTHLKWELWLRAESHKKQKIIIMEHKHLRPAPRRAVCRR